MLDTILSWISDILGELVDAVITVFLGCFTCDLADIAAMFPFFMIGYRIFQAIGLGLILCISIFELFELLFGTPRSNPLQVLVRSGIAGAMLYFGNHLLELIMNLARYPFMTMVSTNGAEFPFGFAGLGVEDLLLGSAVGGSTVILFGIIIMLLIGWNIIKLMIEIMERYVMIGVLAFSAPLVYPTITSSGTEAIFRKWMGMFVGQCMIMTISAWLLKVIISGFEMNAASGTSSFFQLIAVLAMCKIAQRADHYMQQLGIGVATTGGNLLDEVVGVAMAAQRLTGAGRHTANNKDVLGADANGNLNRSAFGGVLGGASNMAQGAYDRWKNGESFASVAHNAGSDFMTGTGFTFGTTVKEGASSVKSGFTNLWNGSTSKAEAAGEMAKGAQKMAFGTAASVAASGPAINTYRRVRAARQAAMDVGGTGEAAGQRANSYYRQAYDGSRRFAQEAAKYHDTRATDGASVNADVVSDDLKSRYSGMGITLEQFQSYNREKFGIGGIQDGELDEVARGNGISWDNDPTGAIWGTNEKLGDFGAANYYDLGLTDNADMNTAMIQTIQDGDPAIAEELLFNPTAELRGNDELGDAVVKKVFSEKELTGHTGGHFSNIHASHSDNPEGGRRVTMDYTYTDGGGRIHTKSMEVATDGYLANNTGDGVGQYTRTEQLKMKGIRSEATNEQAWVKGYGDENETVTAPYQYKRYSEVAVPGDTREPEGSFQPLTEKELQVARDNISSRGYAGDVSMTGPDQAPRYAGRQEHVASYLAEGAAKMKEAPAEQTAAMNTVMSSSPELSRRVLSSLSEQGSTDIRKMEIKDNDELATAILKKGYGGQLPESLDGYHNVERVRTESGDSAIRFEATEIMPGGDKARHAYYLTDLPKVSGNSKTKRGPRPGTVDPNHPMREYRDESGHSFFVSEYPINMQEVSVPNEPKKAKRRKPKKK